jgi:hypothetical protein
VYNVTERQPETEPGVEVTDTARATVMWNSKRFSPPWPYYAYYTDSV